MATELNLNNKRLACTPESGFDVTPGRPGNASRTDSSSRRSPRRRRRHRRRRRQLLRDTGPGRAWVLPRPWRPGSGRRGRIMSHHRAVTATECTRQPQSRCCRATALQHCGWHTGSSAGLGP